MDLRRLRTRRSSVARRARHAARLSPAIVALSLCVAFALPACHGDAASACVTSLDLGCAPLYAPTFDDVYANTLEKTCAQGGSACHSQSGRMGGVDFSSEGVAYASLLASGASGPRVSPGDAACSLLVEKLESTDPRFQMPPGAQLSVAERCAIEQWVAAGAKR